ncbi:MAG: site-2 protease family protein [Burkholderiales bacterium]|jgi:Zn-dependent protease|nr:site-2 protease family protein [Burkholderiales bacterium]
MLSLSIIQKIAIYVLPMIFAITLHEAAHAFVANKYGDNTAKMLGRLSLNPLRHIDPIGTVLFPLIGIAFGGFIFGWAKPVPINFSRLHNPKPNLFWIACSGPSSNLVQALIWGLILKLSIFIPGYFSMPLGLMAQAGISINISLMLLNLLPILPLDGGRMLYSLLPNNLANKYAKIEPYGMWILILLLLIGGLSFIIQPLYMIIVNAIFTLIQH